MRDQALVGLGANLGNPLDQLQQAIVQLREHPHIVNLRTSSIYCTSPVGGIQQSDYLNCALAFQCTLSEDQLLSCMQNIEREMGRVRSIKNGPRIIDLDLLFYGKRSCATQRLTLPHPRWHERLFVLAPLAEVVSHIDWEIPIDVRELLRKFRNPHNETIKVLCTS